MRSPRHCIAPILSLALLVAACAGPTREPVRMPAPIPDPVEPLRGIPPAEVEALRAGEGMGQARAAELNGHPGPRHVLELADSLALTPDQRARVAEVHGRMAAAARAIGMEILAGESGLEASFRAGEMDPVELERRVRALAEQRGRLRLAHLQAHLEAAALLNPAQRGRYYQLRKHGAGPGHH